jgi:hypothetical protein
MLSYHPNCETITNNNTNKFTEMIFITNPNIKKEKVTTKRMCRSNGYSPFHSSIHASGSYLFGR